MHRFFTSIVVAALFAAASFPVIAAEQAKVLGLTIGATTQAEAKSLVAEQRGRIRESAISAITGGPLLEVDGDMGLGGLRTTSLIFDEQGKLVAAQLTLPKSSYPDVTRALKGKYTLKSSQEPFVGNRSSVFTSGQVEIRAESPHMSFEMTLTYATRQFWTQLSQHVESKRQLEQARTANRL